MNPNYSSENIDIIDDFHLFSKMDRHFYIRYLNNHSAQVYFDAIEDFEIDTEYTLLNYDELFNRLRYVTHKYLENITEVEILTTGIYSLLVSTTSRYIDVLKLLPSHIKKLKVSCGDSCDVVLEGDELPSQLEILDMDYPYQMEIVMKSLPKSVHTIYWGHTVGWGIHYDDCKHLIPHHVKHIHLIVPGEWYEEIHIE